MLNKAARLGFFIFIPFSAFALKSDPNQILASRELAKSRRVD